MPRPTTTGRAAADWPIRIEAAEAISSTRSINGAEGLPNRSCSLGSSRGRMPASPMAAPMAPSRLGLPRLSETITATRRPVSDPMPSRMRRALASGSAGRRIDQAVVALSDVGAVDAGAGADQAELVQGDDVTALHLQDRAAFVEVELAQAGVAAGVLGEPFGAVGGGHVGEVDDAALGLGDDLLGDDEHVVVLEGQAGGGGGVADDAGEVIAFLDERDALQCAEGHVPTEFSHVLLLASGWAQPAAARCCAGGLRR